MSDTSERDPRGQRPAGVSVVLAVVFATTGFFALAIFGLGMLSLATNADIIAVSGLGQGPGALGMTAAVLAFAGLETAALRVATPTYRSAAPVALATALAHLVAVALCVLATAGDAVTALAVAGGLVTGGASTVIGIGAAIAAWCGVALRRTRGQHPRWPWEQDAE